MEWRRFHWGYSTSSTGTGTRWWDLLIYGAPGDRHRLFVFIYGPTDIVASRVLLQSDSEKGLGGDPGALGLGKKKVSFFV